MIAIMRTKAQAHKVAELTGCAVILDDEGKPTRKVSLAGDFEQYRNAVESVSVLYQLCDDTGEKVPTGWTISGATFEVQWPKESASASLVRSHFGARRFAYNWALAGLSAHARAKGATTSS